MACRKQRYRDVVMKTPWLLALVMTLSGLYVSVAYMVWRPKVSPEYRAYFIDRTSLEWKNGPRYAAQPEQGIVFGKEGLPTFVRYIYGFSARQPWGRWTDGNRGMNPGIVLEQGMSGSVCLEMRVKPATSQLNREISVTFGTQMKKIVINNPQFSEYFVDYFEPKAADVIEFKFSNPPPSIPDGRRLGVALEYLRLLPETCITVQEGRWREGAE